MDNGSEERKDLKFNEIEKLSQDLNTDYNELIYGESGFSRYAMNHILKDYAGVDEDFRIHAFFEHGIVYTENTHSPVRVHEYLPSMVPSQYRIDVLKSKPNFKGAYAIGPYIHHAKPLLTEEQLKEEKERLGKTLIVFPSHSIDGLIKTFDYEKFFDKIKKVSENFDSVRICMYYKDIRLNHHIPYQKEGFEVVTAGHFNDHNFMRRLKSIIQTGDMGMSNDIGSHLGYCIYLKKPFYLTSMEEVGYKGEEGSNIADMAVYNEKIAIDIINKNENAIMIKKLFNTSEEKITKEQYDLINYIWGFDCVKTSEELRNIFYELEENYSVIKYYLSQIKRFKDVIKLRYIDSRRFNR